MRARVRTRRGERSCPTPWCVAHRRSCWPLCLAYCRVRRAPNDKPIERERASLADQERIDVDGVDHLVKVTREPAEIDQRVDERVPIARLAAAESFDQASGAGRLHHRQGLLAIKAGGRKANVLEELNP